MFGEKHVLILTEIVRLLSHILILSVLILDALKHICVNDVFYAVTNQ